MAAFEVPMYIVDAFTRNVFSGNPAAVCPLEKWLPDQVMQSIAFENGFAETAFFIKAKRGFDLRWFTPSVEMDLCGHATLASAFVLYEHLGFEESVVEFSTMSGILTVRRTDKFEMDFPGRKVESCTPPASLLEALKGSRPKEFLESGAQTYIVVFDSEREVLDFKPDFAKLEKVDRCVNITAPGQASDFVSRFFGPGIGIPEDPVTGSAHCGLAIYWSRRLKRSDTLHAVQLSRRRGEIYCRVEGDRVKLAGDAVLYLKGKITI